MLAAVVLLCRLRNPKGFLKQAVVPPVKNNIVCVCVCRWGYSKAVPLARVTPHYPYCLSLCTEVGWDSSHWAQSPRWPNMPQDGRQTDWGRGGCSLFIALGPPYASWLHQALGSSRLPCVSRWASSWSNFSAAQLPQHQDQVKVTSPACWSAS